MPRKAKSAGKHLADARQIAFLKAYEKTGTISAAARAAKISRDTHYGWIESDPSYPAKFESAHQAMIDGLEEILRAMAKNNPVPAMFLLKRHRPEYRENYKVEHEHTGPGGGPMTVTIELVTPATSSPAD